MKIPPVGAEFHADRQTGVQTDGQDRHDEANNSFSQFANVPKILHSVDWLTVRVCMGPRTSSDYFPILY